MAIELTAHFAERAIPKLRKTDGLPESRQSPQARDDHHRNRRKSQQRDCVVGSEKLGQLLDLARGFGAEDVIKNKFQRPRLEQTQSDFEKQRAHRADDQAAILPQMRPEISRDAPQTRQAFLQFDGFRH